MNFKNIILVSIGLFLASVSIQAQGIEFFHGTWPEALEKAKAEQKLIFVDAYASWCGPCKRMASQTFPDEKVGTFFNGNFICMKIDMEKSENAEFAGKFPVRSYPTLMFIDGDGKLVHKEIGAKNVDQLIETGRNALGRNDKSQDYEKLYEEGGRDPQMLFDYVRALNAANKSSLKITNEYLSTQNDLSSNFNLRFILEGAVEADSRVFDLLVQYKDKIVEIAGADKVNARIESACVATLNKAIAFKSEALLAEAKTKMKAGNSSRADAFASDADMTYYKSVKDAKNFIKAAKKYQKAEVKNNALKLHELCVTIVRFFPEDKNALSLAAKWAKKAAENGGLAEYWMTLAGIYKLQGNMKNARAVAEKAKSILGENDNMMKSKIDYFIQSLGEG